MGEIRDPSNTFNMRFLFDDTSTRFKLGKKKKKMMEEFRRDEDDAKGGNNESAS